MNRHYKRTLYASYTGYITQAIVNNLAPLLFVTFQQEFAVSLEQIGFLVTFNFAVQMAVDILAARYVDRVGYKPSVVAAHIFSFAGLVGMGTLPYLLPSPYAGLLAAISLYAVGGGLIEVLISPIVQALPTEEKSSAMSLLHSFYCWGHVAVVLVSTLFFVTVGIRNWRYLAFFWSLIPLANSFLFLFSPVDALGEESGPLPVKQLFTTKIFWVFFLLMLCAGAAEQAMSQWASYFAESGLKVSKTVGDLLGPCMFAVCMGLSRTFYGKRGEKINLKKFICASCLLCTVSYLITVFSPHPLLALAGCGLCGLSVGILWPGALSLSAHYCPQGATAMFALLALAGDIGCAGGPSVVGVVSDAFHGNIKAGLLAAIVFPLCLLLLMSGLKTERRKGEA